MFREVAEISKEVHVHREEKEAHGLMSLLVRDPGGEEPANGPSNEEPDYSEETRGVWCPRSQ